jgi:hypothetical protein
LHLCAEGAGGKELVHVRRGRCCERIGAQAVDADDQDFRFTAAFGARLE